MRKTCKKKICALVSIACIAGATLAVSADTVEFTITANTDTLSRKVTKSGTYYENKAYVTATYFNRAGTFQCMSVNYDKPNIASEDMYVSGTGGYTGENDRAKDTGIYHPQAPAGDWYYMSASAYSNGLNMLGRFTP